MNAGGRVVTVAAAPQGGDDDEAGRPAAGQCLAADTTDEVSAQGRARNNPYLTESN